MMRTKMSPKMLLLLLLSAFPQQTDGFGSNMANHRGRLRPVQQHRSTVWDRTLSTTKMLLVSEEDVLEAVEQAEMLWAQALEARKTANALSDRAEEEAEAAAGTAKEAENIFQNQTTPVSMEQLVQVDKAAKSNLDATSMVNRAVKASEEADRLEQLAEEALRKSEEQLEQHLKDFPDSPLAQED
ncbi:hypothetical protein IV203_031130 [Nitzschia inconspicua]|uniref:Uncharacterized protein n=1 Tax=Nitzschia inconspicua TaxID=303405 RepID=A0A9K3LUB4_9STRA|nr:hypothetical protein IV203_031130 [Nitzschia inconspicua]